MGLGRLKECKCVHCRYSPIIPLHIGGCVMHPAEISIRNDISNLTLYRLSPITLEIKRDIKYAFWHGFIDVYIYEDLLKALSEKRDSLFEY